MVCKNRVWLVRRLEGAGCDASLYASSMLESVLSCHFSQDPSQFCEP
jgi:hypothetical protein